MLLKIYGGFPDGPAGKESACNARETEDARMIPGSGRSLGGHGNPLQYSCWEHPMDRGPSGVQSISLRESDMTEVTEHACKNMWIDKTLLEKLHAFHEQMGYRI